MKRNAKFQGGFKNLKLHQGGWVAFIYFVVSLVLSIVLSPKPAKPRSAALEDFDVPTAEEDRPIPVLFGTKRITGANVLWYGALQTSNIKKHSLFSSQTVGYKYYLGMHLGLCHGPVDALTKIEMGEKSAWTGNVTANSTISINAPDLFGGNEREGGISGDLGVEMGEPTQIVNGYLAAQQGTPMPAYRGIFGLVWAGGYLGNTPYIKAWAVTARRILKGWQNDTPWYPEKAVIGVGMNPAHIVYQCMTDPEWGQGSPAALLDDAVFRAVADQLYDEGFALNMLWNQQTTIDDFVGIVMDHIAGLIAFNLQTGKYEIRLIRGDYDPDTLETFGVGNILEVNRFERRSWAETVNELTVVYTDPVVNKATAIIVQDLGNIRAQQARIPEKIDMSGIADHELIKVVAGRELAARSTPLARMDIKVNRRLWSYGPAQVFKVTWPRYDVADVVFRVLNMKGGTLESGAMTVSVIEDIYALPGIEYTTSVPPAAVPIPPIDPPTSGGSPNVFSHTLTSPPLLPSDGDRYFIPAEPAATGAWAGHEGDIAEWDDDENQWAFIDVPPGVVIFDEVSEEYFSTDGNGNITLVSYSPGGGGISASGYGVTQAYLWFVKTAQGTQLPSLRSYFVDRIRGRGQIVDLEWRDQSNPWVMLRRNAYSGEVLGSVNIGMAFVQMVKPTMGERYAYIVGKDNVTNRGKVRKIDLRAIDPATVISAVTVEEFDDPIVEFFYGLAQIGEQIYVSGFDGVDGYIVILDADTLEEVDRWTYSTTTDKPGRLITDGVDLWALNSLNSADGIMRINTTTGAMLTFFSLAYHSASDGQLIYNAALTRKELWIAHLSFSGQQPRLVRYVTTSGNVGEYTGLDYDANVANGEFWTALVRDGDLLSYGMRLTPKVISLATTFPEVDRSAFSNQTSGFYVSPVVLELDTLPEIEDQTVIDFDHSYVPVFEEATGMTQRLLLADLQDKKTILSYSGHRTLQPSDIGKLIEHTSGSATLTLPFDEDLRVGVETIIQKAGAGDLAVTPDSGVSLRFFDYSNQRVSTGTINLVQGSTIFLFKDADAMFRAWGFGLTTIDSIATNLLVYPLTYDEVDGSGGNALTRQGSGSHITPSGFEGDGYEARYRNASLPLWVGTNSSSVSLHASVTMLDLPRATRDVLASLCDNDATANPKLELAVMPDTVLTTEPNAVARAYTGSLQTMRLGRRQWQYQYRFPELSFAGNAARPQGILFIDADTVLVSAHYEDRESRVHRIDLTTGEITGTFTFGAATHRHIAAWAMNTAGDVWCTDYETHHTLKIDLDASFLAGTAVILVDWDTSLITGLGAIDFITVSGTDYVLLAEYATSGTVYLYIITEASMSGSFALASRYKRFDIGLRVQGIVEYSGTLYVSRNHEQGASVNGGYVQTYAIATAIGSTSDGTALSAVLSRVGAGYYMEDIDRHPKTGHFWTLTEGRDAVGDANGWLAIWSSPLDNTSVENHYTASYNGAGTVRVRVNNQVFDEASWTPTVTPVALSIGGPPQAAAGWASGFCSAYVRNVCVADGALSEAQYLAIVGGSYELSSLTAYVCSLTNPGAETGDTSGWTNETGSLGVRSATPAPYSGSYYFDGGANLQTISRQRFSIATVTGLSTGAIDTAIAAGAIWGKARWRQANFNGINDSGGVGIRYLDGTPTLISLTYGGLILITPALTWGRRCFPVTMPSGSRNIDIVQRMDRTSGTNNDDYHDDLELVIYQK